MTLEPRKIIVSAGNEFVVLLLSVWKSLIVAVGLARSVHTIGHALINLVAEEHTRHAGVEFRGTFVVGANLQGTVRQSGIPCIKASVHGVELLLVGGRSVFVAVGLTQASPRHASVQSETS